MSTYSDVCGRYLEHALMGLLKKYPEQEKKLKKFAEEFHYTYDEQGHRKYLPFNPLIKCTHDDKYTGRYAVRFNLQVEEKGPALIYFTLDLYPECCALHQLNNFNHANTAWIDTAFFKEFVECCIRAYSASVNVPRRFMINFVQLNRHASVIEDPCNDTEFDIHYPLWYEWAKSFPTTEQRFVNHNTMRIIHNVVVNYQG